MAFFLVFLLLTSSILVNSEIEKKNTLTQFADGFFDAARRDFGNSVIEAIIGSCISSVEGIASGVASGASDIRKGSSWGKVLDDFANVLSSGLGALKSCGGEIDNPFVLALTLAVDSYKIASTGKKIIQDWENSNYHDAGEQTFYLIKEVAGLKGISENKKSIIERSVPAEWNCPEQYYNTSDGCDCNCGAIDPDCEDNSTKIYGCHFGFGVTCNSGICAYETTIPSQWWCSPANYDSSDGCHCNCGTLDPDCLKPNQFSHNCPCGHMTCHNELGTCVGVCEGFLLSVQVDSSVTVTLPFALILTSLLFFMI